MDTDKDDSFFRAWAGQVVANMRKALDEDAEECGVSAEEIQAVVNRVYASVRINGEPLQ